MDKGANMPINSAVISGTESSLCHYLIRRLSSSHHFYNQFLYQHLGWVFVAWICFDRLFRPFPTRTLSLRLTHSLEPSISFHIDQKPSCVSHGIITNRAIELANKNIIRISTRRDILHILRIMASTLASYRASPIDHLLSSSSRQQSRDLPGFKTLPVAEDGRQSLPSIDPISRPSSTSTTQSSSLHHSTSMPQLPQLPGLSALASIASDRDSPILRYVRDTYKGWWEFGSAVVGDILDEAKETTKRQGILHFYPYQTFELWARSN